MSILISLATKKYLLMMAFDPASVEKTFTECNYVTNSETIGTVGKYQVKHKKNNNVLTREIFDGHKYMSYSSEVLEISKNQFSHNGGVLVYHEDDISDDYKDVAGYIRDTLIDIIDEDIDNTESDIISHSIDQVVRYFDFLKVENGIEYKGKYILYTNFSKTSVGQLGYNRDNELSLDYKDEIEDLIIRDNCIIDNIFYSYEISKIFDYKKHEKLCTVIHSVKDVNGVIVDLSELNISNKLLKEISIKYNYLNVINQHFIKKELIPAPPRSRCCRSVS